MGQHEFADIAVQRKAVHAVPAGNHQHGRRAVQRIACASLRGAGLQEILRGRIFDALGRAQDRENRADGNVHVDVGRAVERIKHQQILALRISGRNGIDIIHFLGSHRGQVACPFGRFDENFVGDDVQFLLGFALHVLAARAAQHADQRTLVDIVCDLFAGDHDVADQAGKIAARARNGALLFDDELDQTFAHASSFIKIFNWCDFTAFPCCSISLFGQPGALRAPCYMECTLRPRHLAAPSYFVSNVARMPVLSMVEGKRSGIREAISVIGFTPALRCASCRLQGYLVSDRKSVGSFSGNCATLSMMVYCLPKMSATYSSALRSRLMQ